jgi:hypothetical protein
MTRDEEIAELKARVAELERAAKPTPPSNYVAPSPYRHLDQLGMPASVMAEMARAVPDREVRAIFSDRPARAPSSPIANAMPKPAPMAVNTTGWRESQPLGPPAGVKYADRLMDAADKADRIELAQRLARQKLAEGKG